MGVSRSRVLDQLTANVVDMLPARMLTVSGRFFDRFATGFYSFNQILLERL